jgi:hypothetical protein
MFCGPFCDPFFTLGIVLTLWYHQTFLVHDVVEKKLDYTYYKFYLLQISFNIICNC